MKNVLWLVSWYPNRYDESHANFIQRQAVAVSAFARVHVLYIHPTEEKVANGMEESIKHSGNLTEQIIYYHTSGARNLLARTLSINRYYKLAKKYISQYVENKDVPDYVHVQVPVRAGTLAIWMKKKFGTRYALTEHYGIYNREVVDPFEGRSSLYRLAVKRIIEQAQPFIVVSKQLGDDIHRIGIKKEFVSIPNVVDTSLFQFRERTEQNQRFRFLHVSNMIPLKNVEGIIDACKLLAHKRSDFELLITGRAPAHIKEYAAQSGLLDKQITFTNEIPYNQVAAEMQQADLFILFSRSESSSCVLQESLCCGLPVLSTPVGIALEQVNDTNGKFVAINDVNDLCDKMNKMIEQKQSFDRKMISVAATQLFSYEAIGKKIVAFYGS